MAGTIRNRSKEAGVNLVNVGNLYLLTNGRIGCQPRTALLTKEVVAACSIDPSNPVHKQLLCSRLVNY